MDLALIGAYIEAHADFAKEKDALSSLLRSTRGEIIRISQNPHRLIIDPENPRGLKGQTVNQENLFDRVDMMRVLEKFQSAYHKMHETYNALPSDQRQVVVSPIAPAISLHSQ